MLKNVMRDFWAEPAPTRATSGQGWDRLIVAMFIGLGLLDGLLSTNVAWPPITIPLMVVISFALLWRRTNPLLVAAGVSACFALLHAAMLIAGVSSTMVNVGVLCIAIYSLARWASGRDAVIGLGISFAALMIAGSTGLLRTASGAVGLPIFVSLFLLLGLSIRFWSSRSSSRVSEAKTLERNRIARELHDTVAHHVSAIAVQAQGAQEILATNPDAAAQALGVIEQQASKTLAEMRMILGALRDQDPADRAPQPSIEDIARLADAGDPGPIVDVMVCDDLHDVGPSMAAGLFRLAQEAITNARRHARNTSRVDVQVTKTNDHVRLTVINDGELTSHTSAGFGILGMHERASLLGGTCSARPLPHGGWKVQADLPIGGATP